MSLKKESLVKVVSVSLIALSASSSLFSAAIELGPRPNFLVQQMEPGALKEKLLSCQNMDFQRTDFSIGHRGAAMMFPEHTIESYQAAAKMGAGILECDVTFTKDKELVCRHSQADLHTTTNILATNLAKQCTKPFTAAQGDQSASAECRTSDVTLAEFKTLKGKMDASNKQATTVNDYMKGTANWRTDLYAESAGTLMTHAESIRLFRTLGTKFTPELKAPSVEMPYEGFTQEAYAQKMIDEYKMAGIPPEDVFAQSFNLNDILYWIDHEPEFGKQAVYLDGRYNEKSFDPMDSSTWVPSMKEMKEMGVNYIAPPMWVLVTEKNGHIVPSAYSLAAKEAGVNIITWTLERSGPLHTGGGWYYQSIRDFTKAKGDGTVFELLDVLAQDVGVKGVFSDWPATVSYYANCMALK